MLETSPGLFPPLSDRLVGSDRTFDSGYYDIVRFFGGDAVDPSRVRIQVEPGQYAIGDPLIKSYADSVAEKLRNQGRLYDGPTVTGLLAADFRGTNPTLRVQETSYGDFAGSCFALDMPHQLFRDHGGTLRDYYVRTYAHAEITCRPLANCLGVCGYVIIEEAGRRFLLQVIRAGNLATMAGTPGPSVAGSVDFRPDYTSVADIIQRSLSQEVEEELCLTRAESRITPLAFARELFRADNPQLFALVHCTLTRQQLAERLSAIPERTREFAGFRFAALNSDNRLDAAAVAALNFEARMSYYLAEEYLHNVG